MKLLPGVMGLLLISVSCFAMESGWHSICSGFRSRAPSLINDVQNMIDARADINEKLSPKGYTPLLYAVEAHNEQVTQFLLEHGADSTSTDDEGQTALMLAAQNGFKKIVVLLLQYNPDLGKKDNQGRTVFSHALLKDHDMVLFLISHTKSMLKTQPKLINEPLSKGLTLAYIATCKGRSDIVQFLGEHGADINALKEGRRPQRTFSEISSGSDEETSPLLDVQQSDVVTPWWQSRQGRLVALAGILGIVYTAYWLYCANYSEDEPSTPLNEL